MPRLSRSHGALDNYQYCAEWVREEGGGLPVIALDYGCGAGEIIKELEQRGIEGYGCDVFYEGGDYSPAVPPEWLGSRVLRIENATIPFPSGHFDFIVNNQVMEHVEDLDGVLAEMHRVLKPGGKVLSIFPDRSVWREGHCGIPFLHRFPKGSRPRIYFAALLRAAGLGYHTKDKTIMVWSRDFCEWLDRWTYYRSYRALAGAFERHFSPMQHLEDEWLARRLGSRARYVSWMPAPTRRYVASKLAGLVFVCTK